MSQNYTVVAGKVIDSPSFFGSNPAEVKDGPRKGIRVLENEERRSAIYRRQISAGTTDETTGCASLDAMPCWQRA